MENELNDMKLETASNLLLAVLQHLDHNRDQFDNVVFKEKTSEDVSLDSDNCEVFSFFSSLSFTYKGLNYDLTLLNKDFSLFSVKVDNLTVFAGDFRGFDLALMQTAINNVVFFMRKESVRTVLDRLNDKIKSSFEKKS